MVANISPSSLTYEDTYNTLKYAMRAKKIKSTMKKNVVNTDVNLNHYVKLVDELTKENEELKLQLSMASKTCSCTETTEKHEANIKLEAELKTLYADKRELEQRVAQLESTKQIMTLRKQLKEDANARLSGICSNTPEKQEGHVRLGNAVDRLERQTANIQQEIINLRKRNEHIEIRLHEFLQKAPHLQGYAEKEDAQITYVKSNNKSEHLQKVCDLQAGQLRMRDQLIERFSEVLQPCFLQLRGHGLATETLTASYRGLVRHLQGIRSVTWDDDIASDSGVSSSTNIIEEEESQPIKHQSSEDTTLDRTFVLPSNKPLAPCTDKSIAKGTSTSDETPQIPNSTVILSEGNSNSMEQFVNAVYDSTRPGIPSQNEFRNVCAEELMLKVYDSTHPEIPTQNEFRNVCAEELMLKVYNLAPLEKPNQNDFKNVCAEELMVKVYTPSPEKIQEVPVLDRTRVLSNKQNIISAPHLLTEVSNRIPLEKPSQNGFKNVKVYVPSPRKKQKVSVLDRTRMLSNNKPNIISTSQLSTKVHKSPKAMKRNGVSPTSYKENKSLVRARPIHGTNNNRIGSGQDKVKNSITSTLKPSTITRAFSPKSQK